MQRAGSKPSAAVIFQEERRERGGQARAHSAGMQGEDAGLGGDDLHKDIAA